MMRRVLNPSPEELQSDRTAADEQRERLYKVQVGWRFTGSVFMTARIGSDD